MKFIEFLKKRLFPPKCVFCRAVLVEDGVCDKCKKSLPYRTPSAAKEAAMFIDGVFSVFHYDGDVRNAVLRYKFGGLSKYSVDFSEFLKKCIDENLQGKYDIISWVPLSGKRLKTRGYDQSELLAKEVCLRLGEKEVRTLVKCRNSAPQSRQNDPSKRMANVLGAYDISDAEVAGKRIILIDDVYTSGSTTSECARVLKTAGADKVYVVTLAKARRRKKELKN